MIALTTNNVRAARPQWAQVMAATVRFTRNLDLAEVAVEDAFARARPEDSVARLVALARAMALHLLRRDMTFVSELPLLNIPDEDQRAARSDVVRDDRRTLAYICCHPALPVEARITLMLRLVCGLSVAEIARRLDERESTIAERLTDAKNQLRADGIPYEVPTDAQFADRVQPVLAMIVPSKEPSCYSSETSSTASPAKSAPWSRSLWPWPDSANNEAWARRAC